MSDLLKINKFKVCVLILNWNGYSDTCECLDSLSRINLDCIKIIVVDNASTDLSASKIENWAKQNGLETFFLDWNAAQDCITNKTSHPTEPIVLIQTGKNLGFAGGNNVGIRYCLQYDAEFIWILNNDTIVDPKAVDALLEPMYWDDRIGITGSCVAYFDRPHIVQTAGMRLGLFNLRISHLGRDKQVSDSSISKLQEVDCVPACSMLVRTKMIKAIGLMNEEYFMYHEDVDWQIRAKRAGWKIFYVPASRILHKCGGSTRKSRFVAIYYQSRNKFLLIAKNGGMATFILMIPLLFAFLCNLFRALLANDRMFAWGMFQGAKDFFMGRTGMRRF